MVQLRIAGMLLALTAIPGLAAAANLPEGWSEPTVAHEGTRVMSVDGTTVESRYRYMPPGKTREEVTMEGMSVSLILRQDLGVVWTVLPGNMYMEMAIDEADMPGTSPTEGVVEFEVVGEEEIDGWPTTRYRVVMLEDGEEATGYFWITEHWIPIRMEITMADDPDERISWHIRDLRITEQDPALFEVPAGARNMGSFGR